MLYIVPTKRGLGLELWGNRDDLDQLYKIISNNYLDEQKVYDAGYANREKVISGFGYNVRKAMEGQRLQRKQGHFSYEALPYFGCTVSWPHILFVMTALKFNLSAMAVSKLDLAHIQLLEYWLEYAMTAYDPAGAKKLSHFIYGLYGGNPCLYQFMRSINLQYISLGGGKTNFRKLPDLLKRGILFTTEYMDYMKSLEKDAARLNCAPAELELDDDDFDYDAVPW